jgi:hypothetical protein
MTNEAADILRKAKELIETKGWTRGAMARRKNGDRTSEYGEDAARFCLFGALLRAEGPAVTSRACRSFLLKAIAPEVCLLSWNDKQCGKKVILLAFDRAIALAEANNA